MYSGDMQPEYIVATALPLHMRHPVLYASQDIKLHPAAHDMETPLHILIVPWVSPLYLL